jgi:hypothetical protein
VPADRQDEKKQYKAHSQRWFKTEDGARELLAKVFGLGVWPLLKVELLRSATPFARPWNLTRWDAEL